VSSSRSITLTHAENIHKMREVQTDIPEEPGVEVLIAEMDGCMVPIVETTAAMDNSEKIDCRKSRKVEWKEARLCLAHPQGSMTPVYGAIIGTPEQAGDQLLHCAIQAGLGTDTKVHGLGDGAPWIADQISLQFGLRATYTVDFCHVCDYMSAAGAVCAGQDKQSWFDEQKNKLRASRISELLEMLEPHLESETVKRGDAPVRTCYQYIANRPGQFDYKRALDAGLPIGSGEVESGHRHVIQERLKLCGAWWKTENAQYMLSLRTLRANGDWQEYWAPSN
jgi:hypothetical protein